MATFNVKSPKYITLIFHKGASLKDMTGLLEGDHEIRRSAKFYDMDDVKAKAANLKKVVNDWVKLMDK